MEIDMDLLEEVQEKDKEIVEEIVADIETDTGTNTDVEVSPVEEEFDSSTPLSPREKILMERLERITGENLNPSVTAPQINTTPPAPQGRVFIDENTDINEVFSSRESINKLLALVYSAALEDASKLTAENIMKGLPDTISTYTAQHISMTKLIDDFYVQNSDLVPVKKTVAAVANEVSAEHPEFSLEQVLNEGAKRTREILKIPLTPVTKAVTKPKTPAFVSQRSANGRVKVEEVQGLAKEIADLLS